MSRGSLRIFRLTAIIAPAMAILIAAAPAPALADEGRYSADFSFDAACPQGQFPVSIDIPSGFLTGTLSIALASTGRVTGTLTSGGSTHVVSGKHKVRWWGQKLILSGGLGRTRFKFSGRVSNGVAAGRFRDRGTIFQGRGNATIDLRAAGALRVAFDVDMQPVGGQWFHGTGAGDVCGDAFAVVGDIREGRFDDKMWVDGPALRWKCRGGVVGTSFRATSWKLRTHGIRLAGTAATLSFAPPEPDPPPEPTNPAVVLLTVSGHPENLFFPAPYLGAEYGPALLSAIRSTGITAVEEDFVDDNSTSEGDGHAGLLATMRWVRDNWVNGAARPTSVVIVAHSHGGTWAHEAIRSVPDLTITALVDLDTSSCGWSATHPFDALFNLDPVSAYRVGDVWFDAEDVVWGNVAIALEVWSNESCIDPFANEPYDDASNIRSNGTYDGLWHYDSNDSHRGTRTVAGESYPVVRDWLLEVLESL